ncbi:MAG: hypothetical protein RMJ98_08050 [Myxococcales bacterium]|nr:hypothetical protein [Polyangiaceae bacterium]MDW8249238.1 hypothetical protein [Myxococcales bacterium]
MILRKIIVLSALFSCLGPFAGGCQSGGVGDPCIPEDEYLPRFAGFSASEVNIESRSFQCETRVCLVNHFRGRVSCPLGQDQALADKAKNYAQQRAQDGSVTIPGSGISSEEQAQMCHIPGSSGDTAELVQVSVLPQCTTRQAKDVVYCSCRCAGPDPDARYCDCPSGFTCTPFPELDLGAAVAQGSGNLSGSYCVKDSDIDPATKRVNYKPGVCPQAPTAASLADKCDKSGNCGVENNLN